MSTLSDAETRLQTAQLYLKLSEENVALIRKLEQADLQQGYLREQNEAMQRELVIRRPSALHDKELHIAQAKIKELQLEIDNLNRQMNKTISEKDALAEECSSLKGECSRLSSENQASRLDSAEKQTMIQELRTDMKKAEDHQRITTELQQTLSSKSTNHKAAQEALTRKLKTITEEYAISKKEFESLEARHTVVSRELEKTKHQLTEADHDKEEYSAALEATRHEIEGIKSAAILEKERPETIQENARSEIQGAQKKIDELQEDNQQIKDAQVTLAHELQKTSTKVKDVERELATEKSRSAKLTTQLNDAESKVRRTKAEVLFYRSIIDDIHNVSIAKKDIPRKLYSSFLPDERYKELSELHDISANDNGTVYFIKKDLSRILGGKPKENKLVVVNRNPSQLAMGWNISQYLCANSEANPWAPTKCGQHGYIFPPEDVLHLIKGEVHLFIGVGGQFAYCGLYQVSRCKPLSLDEWNRLSDWVKQQYFKATKMPDEETEDDISWKVRKGEREIICLRLRCIEFDEVLYDRMTGRAASGDDSNDDNSSDKKSEDESVDSGNEQPAESDGKHPAHSDGVQPAQSGRKQPVKSEERQHVELSGQQQAESNGKQQAESGDQ